MLERKYTFIDLFAGCGGLSEGFLQSNKYEALAHVEWELPMVNTLRKRIVDRWGETEEDAKKKVVLFDIQRTDELIYGNWSQRSIMEYAANNAKEAQCGLKSIVGNSKVDVIIGGPPCQAYSIHGRATDGDSMKDDYRNYLFESFVKVVDAFKPSIFVFENVTGMLSAKPGGKPIVDRIYNAFKEIGYDILPPGSFKHAIFDANDYDVPQSRKRVILFGVKNDSAISLDNLYEGLKNQRSLNAKLTVKDAIGALPPIYPLSTVIKEKGRNVSHYATDNSDLFHQPRHCSSRDIEIIQTWIGNNMNECTQKEAIQFYKKVTGRDTLYLKYRNLEFDKPSPTIVAHLHKDGYMFIHPDIKQARFITIREAALLMSFPADFEFVGSRASCYKMIGNAVPVNFATAIANSIYKVLHN